MHYCIVESRDWIPSSRWPQIFHGTLAECRAYLANTDARDPDQIWITKDGLEYTRGADLTTRHICRAWWAQSDRVVNT